MQSEREAFAGLISASVLPNFTANLAHLPGESPPLNRVEAPVLDPEAAMPFYLCTLRKNRRLPDCITIPEPEANHVRTVSGR